MVATMFWISMSTLTIIKLLRNEFNKQLSDKMIVRNFNLKIEFLKHPQNLSLFMLKNVTIHLIIKIKYLLVSIGTYSSSFIKFVTVDVRVIIKCSVLAFNGPTPFLVLEMPVKTCEGTVLLTFVLKKLRTLLNSELL